MNPADLVLLNDRIGPAERWLAFWREVLGR